MKMTSDALAKIVQTDGDSKAASDSKAVAEKSPIQLSIRRLNQVREAVEQSLSVYEYIGRADGTGNTVGSHVQLRDQLKNLLNSMKNKLNEIEETQVKIQKNTLNKMLINLLNSQWETAHTHVKQEIAKLQESASKLQQLLADDQNTCFKLIILEISSSFNLTTDYSRNELLRLIEKKLFTTALQKLGSDLLPMSTCFISYSWTNAANVARAHRLARDLKLAGVQVKLDIWDNTTGSVNVFTENVNIVDYVIVVGTPDLKEKWDNFCSSGKTREQTGKNYHGNVVCQELDMILSRITNKPNDNHGIINLLLEGEHIKCFPNKLSALPSSDTDFRERSNDTHAFFNLLERLKPDAKVGSKSNAEKYQQLLEQKKKELFIKLQHLNSVDDNQLLSFYQACVGDSQKTYDELSSELLKDLKYPAPDANSSVGATATATPTLSLTSSSLSGTAAQKSDKKTVKEDVISVEIPQKNPWFVDRLPYRKFIDDVFRESTRCVLHGLGGIGKSQLAYDYSLYSKAKYLYTFKLRAERLEMLYDDISSLGKYFKMCLNEDKNEQVKQIITYIETELKSPILLLFDNVESSLSLEGFLPSKNAHVLITSRNGTNYPSKDRIEVKPMTIEEGVTLIKTLVKRVFVKEEEEQLKLLVRDDLACHPLALVQAGAYIENCKTTISGYRKLFKAAENAQKLLGYDNLPSELKYTPAMVTFDLNFEAIKDKKPLAINLLDICSYSHADNIPFWFMKSMLKIQDLQFNELKEILIQYSLMSFYPTSENASIHRILQAVRKSKKTQKNESYQILNELTTWLDNQYDYNYNDLLFEVKCGFLVHVLSMIEYIENEKKEGKLLNVNVSQKTYYCIGLIYLDFHYMPDKSQQYLKKALDLLEPNTDKTLSSKIYRQYAKCLSRINPNDPNIEVYFAKAIESNSLLKSSVIIDKFKWNFNQIRNGSETFQVKIESLDKLAKDCLQAKQQNMGDDILQSRYAHAYVDILCHLYHLILLKIDYLESNVQEIEQEISELKKWQTKILNEKESQKKKCLDEIVKYETILRFHEGTMQSFNTKESSNHAKIDCLVFYSHAKLNYKRKNYQEALKLINGVFIGDNFRVLPSNLKLNIIIFYANLLEKNGDKNGAINMLVNKKILFDKKEDLEKIEKQLKALKTQTSRLSYFAKAFSAPTRFSSTASTATAASTPSVVKPTQNDLKSTQEPIAVSASSSGTAASPALLPTVQSSTEGLATESPKKKQKTSQLISTSATMLTESAPVKESMKRH